MAMFNHHFKWGATSRCPAAEEGVDSATLTPTMICREFLTYINILHDMICNDMWIAYQYHESILSNIYMYSSIPECRSEVRFVVPIGPARHGCVDSCSTCATSSVLCFGCPCCHLVLFPESQSRVDFNLPILEKWGFHYLVGIKTGWL